MLLRKHRVLSKEFPERIYYFPLVHQFVNNKSIQLEGTYNFESLGHNEQVITKEEFLNQSNRPLRSGNVRWLHPLPSVFL